MKLIVGLGNPGKQYEKTRHNIGFMVLDKLALFDSKTRQTGNETWSTSKKSKAQYLIKKIAEQNIELLKPQTFMNESGSAVAYAIKNNNLSVADIIVVHDDKDLPLGKIKIQARSSAAGHNGVQSIINHLKTNDFVRIRVGIASDNPIKMNDTSKFVLHKFGFLEKKKVNEVTNQTAEAVISLLNSSIETVMNKYN